MRSFVQIAMDKLNSLQREQLKQAFEACSVRYFEYEQGKFVGVNCELHPLLECTVVEGFYSVGLIKGKANV